MSYGDCKICRSSLSRNLNKRLARGDSDPQIMAWAGEHDFKVTKPTLIRHKRHITDPKTTVVEEARKNPAIKRVSHDEFLQSLVDIGAAKAAANPDDVSLDQAIRAAQALSQKGNGQVNVLLMLAQRMAPRAPELEGEWQELPALEGSDL